MNLIIGAGPAGLFCANELMSIGKSCVILEKQKNIAGLAATYKFGKSKFEVGPHILFTQDQEILDIAKKFLGDELITKEWSVAQYIEGHFFKFPNSALEMTRKLGIIRMIKFFYSYAKYRGRDYNNYEEFIYSKVGKLLAEFNVINYTEKMWGVSLNDLETEWIKPRLERLSIVEILKNTINPKPRTFFFPRLGSGQLYDEMTKRMQINKEEHPLVIEHDGSQIVKVKTNLSQYPINHLFSSMSLPDLIPLLTPEVPPEVLDAALGLKYRSQIYVVLKFDKTQLMPYQWLYFNETHIPFCRVHEPKNFTDTDDSQEETLLVVEYFCFAEDTLWGRSDEEMKEITMQYLSKMAWLKGIPVVDYKVLRKRQAYPLMSQSRQQNLDIIQSYLDKFKNLSCIGRHGLHTYDNQDTAGRTGIDAANRAFA